MTKLTAPTQDHPPRACPLCGTLAKDVQFEYASAETAYPLYGCKACTGLFIRPMPIEKIAERKMDSLEDAELLSPAFKLLHEKLILAKEARTVRSLINKSQIELLDIGCGTGWSTDFWRRNGFAVEAVEPSPARCRFARTRYGLTVHNCYVEEMDLTRPYDVVVLRHLIEHLEKPAALLQSVAKLLRPDGLLLIVVPNLRCIGKKFFGRHWEWVVPWHCNFFTPRALEQFVVHCGYAPLASHQSPSPLYYAESLGRAMQSPALEKFFSRHRLAGLSIALPLAIIGLCTGMADNITLVARPPQHL